MNHFLEKHININNKHLIDFLINNNIYYNKNLTILKDFYMNYYNPLFYFRDINYDKELKIVYNKIFRIAKLNRLLNE